MNRQLCGSDEVAPVCTCALMTLEHPGGITSVLDQEVKCPTASSRLPTKTSAILA